MSPPAHLLALKRFQWSLGLALAIATTISPAAEPVLRFTNSELSVAVDPASGRVVKFIDRVSNQNFVAPDSTAGELWEVEFNGPSPNRVSPTNAQQVEVEVLQDDRNGWRTRWSGFGAPSAPGLQVEMTVELVPDRSLSRWNLAVLESGGLDLARLYFPRLRRLPHLDNERLAMPFWAGLLASEPRKVLGRSSNGAGRREVDYPGHGSLQCLAFYSEGGPGLYLACDDTAGHRKLFAAHTEGKDDLNLEMTHLPERAPNPSSNYRLPYSVILGAFQGDWQDAAAIYRQWATQQTWAKESRWKRGVVPPWIANTRLWVWNRGRSPGVLPPALALQKTAGLPVSVFWHWWHGCAYDTGFPEYLPPREGAESFAAALQEAHRKGLHALVYMNQRLWGMTTASWTNQKAAVHAVKDPQGWIRPEVYNTFSRLPCASMCLATEFWRNHYADIAERAVKGLGVDGIYMDQACSSLACYDPHHGHPPGGGTYWMKGFQALEADIRRRCADPTAVGLAGEGCAENWLPHLDLMLALDVSRERYAGPDGWDPIPLFHAVYHGYAVFYGSYSSLTMPPYDDLWPAATAPKTPLALLDRKFRRQFCLEQARAFCWGQQPTLANFQPSHLRDRPEEIDYFLRIARLRHQALNYLQDGSLLPAPKVDVVHEEIPMSRLSIYAGQQGGLTEFTKTVPLVLATLWKDPQGKVALAAASLSDRSLSPAFTLDARRHGIPIGSRARLMGDSNPTPAGEWNGTEFILRPRLAPRAVQLWELSVE